MQVDACAFQSEYLWSLERWQGAVDEMSTLNVLPGSFFSYPVVFCFQKAPYVSQMSLLVWLSWFQGQTTGKWALLLHNKLYIQRVYVCVQQPFFFVHLVVFSRRWC